jgi:hypothetical protein
MFKPAIFALGVALCCVIAAAAPPVPEPTEIHLTGPFTATNLSVYFVHGPNLLGNRKVLTLTQAMKSRVLIVHDGGNQLLVDNTCNVDVFLQAGEIVKGGRQDRTLGQDLLAAAHCRSVPVLIHCVEHGRSTPRSGESGETFDASPNALVSKALKLANYADNQDQVWNQVAELQTRLENSVKLAGATVAKNSSPTSLELTVEDKAIAAAAEKYEKALPIKSKDRSGDVVGLLYAINGKLNSGDVYASPDLFGKMYPKLVHAASLEALADRHAAEKPTETLPSIASVESMVKAVDARRPAPFAVLSAGAPAGAKPVVESNYFRFQTPAPSDPAPPAGPVKVETDTMAMYETSDPAGKAAFLHRAYLTK